MYSYKIVQWTFIRPEWRWLPKILSCWLCEPALLKVNFVHLNYTVRRHNTIEQKLMQISWLILTPVAVPAYSVHKNCKFMEFSRFLWRENFRRGALPHQSDDVGVMYNIALEWITIEQNFNIMLGMLVFWSLILQIFKM